MTACRLGWLVIVVLTMTTACSHPVRTDDPIPEETYSPAEEPLRFTAPRPGLSAVGKDYLFMAPVIVSKSGGSEDYLWFALGSTIDRPITGAPQPTFSTIVIDLDGMLMTFDFFPWSEAARADPFTLPIRTRASYGAKVTRSQLARIASAQQIHAYVTNMGNRSPIYEIIKDNSSEGVRW